MGFTVLADDDVKAVLESLTASDVSGFATALEQALIQYSCGDEKNYQPERSVITRPGEQVSLFMPSTTEQSIGVKIVGVSPSQDPAKLPPGQAPPPALQSALTVCDAQGRAVGILNAAELTAFRTALGSMLLYRLRRTTGNIVVFGAGKQAFWHIRLAVILRGDDIGKITVVNRSHQRAQDMINALTGSNWPSHISLELFGQDVAPTAADGSLENLVADADVIFCTTPSKEPLFPSSFLTSDSARSKSRYVAAIGSYRLDMGEIDPELLKAVVDPVGPFSGKVWQGHVAVDSREGCLQEAGELVSADISPSRMLEVGHTLDQTCKGAPPDLQEWLRSGFVIYKSVGVGVMDMAIGGHLLQLANSKNIGVTLPSF